jgi:hypothetical protein
VRSVRLCHEQVSATAYTAADELLAGAGTSADEIGMESLGGRIAEVRRSGSLGDQRPGTQDTPTRSTVDPTGCDG